MILTGTSTAAGGDAAAVWRRSGDAWRMIGTDDPDAAALTGGTISGGKMIVGGLHRQDDSVVPAVWTLKLP